jgi:uncharacterized membrane protein
MMTIFSGIPAAAGTGAGVSSGGLVSFSAICASSNRTMATNVKFAMAMPSAKRSTRMMHQTKQRNWRMNMIGCDRRIDARLCQRLDDVN